MNRVDFLLEHPFYSLDLQTRMLIKKLGPHQPNVRINQAHKTQSRNFNIDWYRRKPWLTASESRMSLYCFYCVLFGGEYPWTRDGVRDLKHLSERVKIHELTTNHIGNCLKIALFGNEPSLEDIDDSKKLSIRYHNEMVDKNKNIVNKVIDCLKLCGSHNISLNIHEEFLNKSNIQQQTFENIFKEFSQLRDNLHISECEPLHKSESVSTYTSNDIIKELLCCIYEVYRDVLREKISEAMYVSVQIDETCDPLSSSQLSLILRFVMGTKLVEAFHGFIDLHDRSPDAKAHYVLREIEEYELRDKLVAYTHDTNTYNKQISEAYPCSCFVHCYSHKLISIMQNICSVIAPIKTFFSNLNLFSLFFSKSLKRVQMINDTCEELGFPLAIVSIENFQDKLATIVHENVPSLRRCFEKINTEPGWDTESIGLANALLGFLNDKQFLFFLEFFSEITHILDYLNSSVLNCTTKPTLLNMALQFFYTSMREVRKNAMESPDEIIQEPSESKRTKIESNKTIALECCDLIVEGVKTRFEAKENLACFDLVDPTEFKNFKNGFPKDIGDSIKFYPSLDEEKLKNELRALLENEVLIKVKNCVDLYSLICKNGLNYPFSESSRLLNISITTPIITSYPERRFSSLLNIQNYLSNTKLEERSNGLAVLSIGKEFIKSISNFNERVIQKFAEQRNCRSELIHK